MHPGHRRGPVSFRWAVVLTGLLAALDAASAAPLYNLTIQPIQVCDDFGLNCANPARTLFEAEGDKIWDQASINLLFLPWETLNNSSLLDLNVDTEFGGPAAGTVIRLLFVGVISSCGGPGTGIFGCGFLSANGVAIADNVFSFNGGIGRLDTIAHELGHNLGLDHTTLGAGGALNLMSSGAVRSIPTSLLDIYPNGLQMDQLTAAQIAVAQSSPFLSPVPEPAVAILALVGFAALFSKQKWTRRRRRPVSERQRSTTPPARRSR
jgi:hypothetical protein